MSVANGSTNPDLVLALQRQAIFGHAAQIAEPVMPLQQTIWLRQGLAVRIVAVGLGGEHYDGL
ncbi:hypothetical protein D3C80_2243740 [compost metagenome]